MAQRYDDRYGRGEWRARDRDRQRDPRREDYSWEAQEYGGGRRDPGSSYDLDYERRFPADNSESPRYFGTGSYSEGGTHFTGGYDQRGRPEEETAAAPYERPTYKRGPKGYQRSDERMKEDISERIMQAMHIDSSDVTVNVVGGQVILEGTVPDRYTKYALEDLADGAPGVQDIDNRIRVRR
jgi:hypothetical protein